MTCWPECNPWCECIDGKCQPTLVQVNAMRLRTRDGRYLKAANGGGSLLEAMNGGPPQWGTFRFVPPTMWPLASGSPISLVVCDMSWGSSVNQVRVFHSIWHSPHHDPHEPELVSYEYGGYPTNVYVYTGFSPDFMGYTVGDPEEWTFTIVKGGGGPIDTGDEISLSITSRRGNTYYFRTTGPQDQALIAGDGTTPFQADTVFVVEFSEVRVGLGFRPFPVDCQLCGTVTGTVTDASSGQAINHAKVEAQGVLENHPFSAMTDTTTHPDGSFKLLDPDLRDCVAAGNVRLQATADRYQSRMIDPVIVPSEGGVVVPIQLVCTEVHGRVVDDNGQAIQGATVILTASDGTQFVAITKELDGTFVFVCVPHGAATLLAISGTDTKQITVTVPPEGASVVIVVPSSCGNVVGTVTDAVTGQQLKGVAVMVIAGSGPNTSIYHATTNEQGYYELESVCPAGSATLTASKSGYNTEVVQGVNIPSSGSITKDIQLRPVGVTAVSEIKFVLTWGDHPSDLDSHLSGPDGQGGRFHIKFNNRAPVDFADLDIDDTTAFGPERVTVRRSPSAGGIFVAGEYHYWVHNFSHSRNGNTPTFGPTDPNNPATASDAVVTVLVDSVQLARYLVANAIGDPADDIWRVVNLQLDTTRIVAYTPIQTLQPGDENTIL